MSELDCLKAAGAGAEFISFHSFKCLSFCIRCEFSPNFTCDVEDFHCVQNLIRGILLATKHKEILIFHFENVTLVQLGADFAWSKRLGIDAVALLSFMRNHRIKLCDSIFTLFLLWSCLCITSHSRAEVLSCLWIILEGLIPFEKILPKTLANRLEILE